jgi:hypothetical protein
MKFRYLLVGRFHETHRIGRMELKPTDLILRRREAPSRRPYVPSNGEATHPRCEYEGYPDGPGRASSKEGEP